MRCWRGAGHAYVYEEDPLNTFPSSSLQTGEPVDNLQTVKMLILFSVRALYLFWPIGVVTKVPRTRAPQPCKCLGGI